MSNAAELRKELKRVNYLLEEEQQTLNEILSVCAAAGYDENGEQTLAEWLARVLPAAKLHSASPRIRPERRA